VRVFVSDPLSRDAIAVLANAGVEVLEQEDASGEQLGVALRGSDALIVRGRTRVTEEVLARAAGLRAVCRAGSGVDNIDLAAARARGIAVFNTPGANAVSVAELTWALILALHRNLVPAAVSTAAGRWEKSTLSGSEVRDRTLGVIGLGQIGRLVAGYGLAFGCRVLGYDPAAPAPEGIETADLDRLLRESDIVTLHVPLDEGTRRLLDRERLASMKEGAVLVNCARGGTIDEEALYEQLVSGRLGGAALDVFAEEPPRDRKLLELETVLATPHIGAATADAQRRAGVRAAEIVRDFLLQGEALGRVV
jgi:D-3-phosphoglycerate dehydrogenase